MKFLPLSLAALLSFAALASANSPSTTPVKDLGKIMFVGDSISHGYSSGSYRWALHKLFVDNEMAYESLGIMTGGQPGTKPTVAPGTKYRGVAFTNTHSAHSSARAWEISGRKPGPRFKGSNIKNWLALSTEMCSGATYSDATFSGDSAPDRFFMMIGTNDLLSDHGNKLASVAREAVPALEKDVDDIIDAMRESNKKAPITLLTIPVWAHRKGIDAADTHTTVEEYNKAMKKSARSRKVKVAEINEGLRDVSDERPFHGHSDLFAPDGLHPNDQGSMIIAGNVAQAMAWPSRTAGLPRKSAADFALLKPSDFQLDKVKAKGSSYMLMGKKSVTSALSCSLPDASLLSVEFKCRVGDGAKKGWDAEEGLCVSLATKAATGELTISECYLMWGDRVIYCADMSQNTAPIRIAYVKGDAKQSIAAGFYIWLGDKLVGEALPADAPSDDEAGVKIEFVGEGKALISGLAIDGEGSYAPVK